MARTLSRQGERALDAAIELARQAMDADGEERRALARQAVARSPLCSWALGLLADAEDDPDAALALWRRAAAAATTVLGPVGLRRIASAEEAPSGASDYLHAMQALARALWRRGQREEAIDAMLRAVRADPGDDYALRTTLIGWLLVTGQDEEAAGWLTALAQQPEVESNNPDWPWATLLLTFRQMGDTAETRQGLRDALELNPHVPEALVLGELPKERLPAGLGPLDPGRRPYDDADCIGDALSEAWHATPGAIAWLQAGGAEAG